MNESEQTLQLEDFDDVLERGEVARRSQESPYTAKALSPRHRRAAQLLASGMTRAQVAGILGLSVQTITNYANHNEEFKTWLATYQAGEDAVVKAVRDAMQCGAAVGVDLLLKKLQEAVEGNSELDTKEILAITTALTDRTDWPRQTKLEVKTNNVGEKMDAARKRLKQVTEGAVDAEFHDVA